MESMALGCPGSGTPHINILTSEETASISSPLISMTFLAFLKIEENLKNGEWAEDKTGRHINTIRMVGDIPKVSPDVLHGGIKGTLHSGMRQYAIKGIPKRPSD